MSIQKSIEIAKDGVIKDVARMWVEQGYTNEDFKILKDYVTNAIVEFEDKCADINSVDLRYGHKDCQ